MKFFKSINNTNAINTRWLGWPRLKASLTTAFFSKAQEKLIEKIISVIRLGGCYA